ncbi:MAG TPA: FG-GAP-like repeat-containing protein [Terriglobia bacterium]|nr:FG-GAP-like repeat-containing protein [Terriglobia bacterium]
MGRRSGSEPAAGGARGELRLIPHYPKPSPLEEVLRYLRPGGDEFLGEKFAEQVEDVLAGWTEALTRSDVQALGQSFSRGFQGMSWRSFQEHVVRPGPAIEVSKRRFAGEPSIGPGDFLNEFRDYLGSGKRVLAAEFKVPALDVRSRQPLSLESSVRYDLVLEGPGSGREEHIGFWQLGWQQTAGKLLVQSWRLGEETFSRADQPLFDDVTGQVLGGIPSYGQQLWPGTDYWRTVLDQASGIDVYGNNGIAAGDIDNDGFDEIYICQPSGLPNRLYRNLGDGTFADLTDPAGVGVLDNTPCALFADVDNDGFQDLLVITAARPLLYLNRRDGTFALKDDAFRFQRPPEGTFTGAAFGDYDRDGYLDVYFCLYSYYKGLDQYQYPRPYYNAVNGPPKFLFRNRGGGNFEDVTARAGLDQNNHHYGFDCTWCDFDDDGWPDLYVVNDFGSKNLYRNNRDGTFTDVAERAGVLDIGPGMSSCWLDSTARGSEDLYVSDMWEPAGLRVTADPIFMKDQPESIRALFRRHAKGNSLYRNEDNGRFEDVSSAAGVERAGWSWSSDAWDFDHDGYPDLYVTNGMISGPDRYDCESFFWRQVVARSPGPGGTSKRYELGWGAINELIRSDSTWAGYQRNVFYLNNHDGTFSEVSGTAGLDFRDDSRAFALTDFDHDGRLELFLKNRSGPQVRVLRTRGPALGATIAIRLRGTTSNRDAVGAVVTVEAAGRRQKKMLRAGSGFVSQHTKELFFGLGASAGPARVQVRWPGGGTQEFNEVPANHRIEIEEGRPDFRAMPFAAGRPAPAPSAPPKSVELPSAVETWLVEPTPAPDFELPGLDGRSVKLSGLRGRPVLLYFWTLDAEPCRAGILHLYRARNRWSARGLQVVSVNVDGATRAGDRRDFAREQGFRSSPAFELVAATDDVAGIYNLLFRYLYDRRRNLGLPASFLVDRSGDIVKAYQNRLDVERLAADLDLIPASEEARIRLALPFPGRTYGAGFSRNYHTYGAAYFQAGYFDQALASFEMVVRRDPNDATAHYNLATIYLQKGEPDLARPALLRALEIRPAYPDALNDLGLLASRAGQNGDAESFFRKALAANPEYVIALQNLGRLYRAEKKWDDARKAFERALQSQPGDAELNFDMGMVFAMQNDAPHARSYFEQAVRLDPGYADAWNNLGVLLAKSGDTNGALKAFLQCVEAAPDYAQGYLNAARVYVIAGDKEKAAAVLRKLLTRHPDDAEAARALERLGH